MNLVEDNRDALPAWLWPLWAFIDVVVGSGCSRGCHVMLCDSGMDLIGT